MEELGSHSKFLHRCESFLYAAQGLDNDTIAARLDSPQQVVRKWRKRFFEERFTGLEERSRGGHLAHFSSTVVVDVEALACEPPHLEGISLSRWSIAEIKREMIWRSA